MAGNVVVLSTGSNHSWLPKNQLQAQIEKTIQAIKARQPDAKIVMVNPVKDFTWGFPSGKSSTTPYDAVTGAAKKFGLQTVDFTPSQDNIHPEDTQELVDKIQELTDTPASQWTPVGDSIASMIAQASGATADYTKPSMTSQYILENFASKIPSAVENAPQVERAAPATADDIQKIYADLFGRTAEKTGLDYWQNLAQQQGADALSLRDQIGRAGLAPEASEVAQRLIDTGESQYLGPGAIWSAAQPVVEKAAPASTTQPLSFTGFLTQAPQENLAQVAATQDAQQDPVVYSGGSSTFDESTPAGEVTGTTQFFDPNNFGSIASAMNQIQDSNSGETAGTTQFFDPNALVELASTANQIQDPYISQVYTDLNQPSVQNAAVSSGGSDTFDESAEQQGVNNFLGNVNDSNFLSSLAQATQETTTPTTTADAAQQAQEQAPTTATGLSSLSLPSTQTPPPGIGSADIQKVYADLFGRTGEQSGVDYWLGKANQGLSLSDITNQMSEAGKDPALQAISQQLVDSGQSQYIGGGSIWNPTQPSYYSYGGRVSPLSTLARYR